MRAKPRDQYQSLLVTFIRSEGHLRSLPSSRRGISDDRAFSILELVVVMAIMMTPAAMGIPAFADAIDSAYVAQAIADIRTLQTEITRFAVVVGKVTKTS